jgi:membrane protein DedA with SNARE-associated domain
VLLDILSDLPQWFRDVGVGALVGDDPLRIAIALFLLTFLLEDAAIAAGAALIVHGMITFEAAFVGLVGGIILGDYGLYLLGKASRRFKVVRSRLPDQSRLSGQKLGLQLLIARIVPGLRLATYPASGMTGVAPLRFLTWITLWAALWCAGLLFMASRISGTAAHLISLPPGLLAILFVLGVCMVAKQFQKAESA